MQNESEPELVERCKAGDHNAFRQLVDAYQSKIYVFAFRLLCNEEDALDAVQETFVKVWQHLPQYHPKFRFSTWLYKIATNCCFDHLRAGKWRKNLINKDVQSIAEIVTSGNLEQNFINKNLAAIIYRLTKQLTPRQQLVFTLKELEGLNVDEIVLITNLSPEKIKSNLYLAKKNIREQIEKIS